MRGNRLLIPLLRSGATLLLALFVTLCAGGLADVAQAAMEASACPGAGAHPSTGTPEGQTAPGRCGAMPMPEVPSAVLLSTPPVVVTPILVERLAAAPPPRALTAAFLVSPAPRSPPAVA